MCGMCGMRGKSAVGGGWVWYRGSRRESEQEGWAGGREEQEGWRTNCMCATPPAPTPAVMYVCTFMLRPNYPFRPHAVTTS